MAVMRPSGATTPWALAPTVLPLRALDALTSGQALAFGVPRALPSLRGAVPLALVALEPWAPSLQT